MYFKHTLLMSWATPITVFCPLEMGMHRILRVTNPSSSRTSWLIQEATSPIFKICNEKIKRNMKYETINRDHITYTHVVNLLRSFS